MKKLPPDAPSAVFARGPVARDARLSQAGSRLTMALGVMGLIVLAVAVFTGLSQARTAQQTAPVAVSAESAAKPAQATAPGDPVPTGPEVPVYGTTPGASGTDTGPVGAPTTTTTTTTTGIDREAGLRAPAMVVDLGEGGAQLAPASQLSADERFAARVAGGGSDTARATMLRDVGMVVPQGSMIPAVLETAIDSDLPGQVRAVVSRDVRSHDGSRVLIPRGSKLVGQYKSAAAMGQTRAFVIWQRLITPAGVSIEIGSAATDRLGRGGLDGEVDNHFFRRFGAAILLSVVSSGLDIATRGGDGASNNTLIIGSPAQASRVAEIALAKQIDIPVTIRVRHGAAVQVSVARDLDFSNVMAAGR
jgi:type IV secretion system protein VirB10